METAKTEVKKFCEEDRIVLFYDRKRGPVWGATPSRYEIVIVFSASRLIPFRRYDGQGWTGNEVGCPWSKCLKVM